jgi:hypothetical protein
LLLGLFIAEPGVELRLLASEFVDFIITDALLPGVVAFVFGVFTGGEIGGSIGNAFARADIVDIELRS